MKFTARDFVLAIIAGDIKSVQEMRRTGASVSEPDQHGWLPIHRAAANDREDIISLLIEWGSPLEERGADGWTPLHLAAVSRSPRAVSALLVAGADIDAKSDAGATPLHLVIGPTITVELLSTVRVLVLAGAAKDVCNSEGKSPLDQARAIQNPELWKILSDESAAEHGDSL